MKTVFLTGGGGFVGRQAARRFCEAGWRVRALLRKSSQAALLPPGVEVVPGDVCHPDSYRQALRGCDAIVHIAGLIRARTLSEFRRVNVGGSAHLAQTANEQCPGAMFVHVSSQAAAGPACNGNPVREFDAPRPVSWYGQSKLEGEKAVQYHRQGPWCVVRPSVVYGPGDTGLLEVFSIVARGIAPILAGGRQRVQLLAVDDLACILLRAAGRPDLNGRLGFAAGDTVSSGELTREVAGMRRSPARLIPVPALAVKLAGLVESIREAVIGKTLPFNRDKAKEILQPNWLCDAEPFLRDLGISTLTPWRQGLRDTCRWYQQHRWVPAGAFEV